MVRIRKLWYEIVILWYEMVNARYEMLILWYEMVTQYIVRNGYGTKYRARQCWVCLSKWPVHRLHAS